jgi:Kef-type K+ transport system membrane component KefB
MEFRPEETVASNRWQSCVNGNRSEDMETFAQLIIFLIAIIVLTRLSARLSRRLGIPAATIQLLVGVLLGPSLFNLLGVPMVLGTWGSPSSGPLHGVLKILAEIGLIQLMFLAGLGVDWRELKKILKLSSSVGVWGFVLTAVSVAIITRVFVDRWSEALAMSAIMAASSFGISVYYFSEAKILGSQVALTVLGATILSGLLAILLMIASQATNYAATYGAFKMTIAVSWFLAKLIMFFAIAYFLTSRFLKLVAKTSFGRNVPRPVCGGIGGIKGHNTKENYLTGKPRPVAGELPKRPRQMVIGYLLLVASLYALAAMHFGSFAAVGVASVGGALLGVSNVEVKEKIAKGLGSVLASIPIGILFIVLGMEVSLKEAWTSIIFVVVLVTVVVMTKLVGSWMATRSDVGSLRERVLISIAILPQGEMGILIAAYLFSRGLVSPSQFSAAIVMVVMLTIISPILMEIVGKLSLRGSSQCGATKQSHEIASPAKAGSQ